MTSAPARTTSPDPRSPTYEGAAPPRPTGTVAAVHQQGDQYRIVFTQVRSGAPAGLTTHSIPTSDSAQLARLLTEHQPELVIRLVPSAATVCRATPLPDSAASNRADLASALDLMAESEFPTSVSAHRRAAGVLSSTPPAFALLVAWPDIAPGDPRHHAHALALPRATRTLPEVWTPELVGLLGLRKALGQHEAIAYADGSSGALAALALGPQRAIARVARLQNSTDSAWAQIVGETLSETAEAAGITESPVAPADRQPRILIPGKPASISLAGAQRDQTWLNNFGAALGAILIACDADDATRSLVRMHARAPSGRNTAARRALAWINTPSRAASLIAACIALALGVPLGGAAARHALLVRQTGGMDSLDKSLAASEQQLAFYSLLNERRWPMTKLMADLAGAAPVGVSLDMIELIQGEAVTIRGTADTPELVTEFREKLTKSRVFTQVGTPNIETTADAVEFQLQARVPQNHALTANPPRPDDDFAAKTLAQRLYGDAAGPSSASDAEPERASDSPDRSRRGSRSSIDSSRGSGTERSREPSAPPRPAVGIPPPISDADIAKMDRMTAMKEWAKRKNASVQSGIDADTKARLADESLKCKTRMDEATATPAATTPAPPAPSGDAAPATAPAPAGGGS